MNSYTIFVQYAGCGICKRTPDGRKWYLRKIYKGQPTWSRDYTYAKLYSHNTVTWHLRNLRANDPECEEDC